MLKNKRIDPRDTETVEWGELVSETKTCVEFEELPGRYGIRTSQIFDDAEIDVFVGEYETSLGRITSGNPSETEFYASGGMAYIIVNAAHVGQDIRADYFPGGSVLTAEVLDSEAFKGPAGPQGPTGPAGAPGDVSDVENVGAGVGVFKDISAGTARFKSLAARANIDIDTTDPDEIGISVNSGSLVGDAINAADAATPVDADKVGFWQVAGSAIKYFTWGELKTLLQTAFANLFVPVGALLDMAGIDAAPGYYACDGTAKDRSTDAALFNYTNKALGNPTLSIASPCVVSLNSHGLSVGDRFFFETTGALPTNVSANTQYYVISSGFGANSFRFSTSVGGSAVNSSGSQSGTHTLRRSPFGIPNSAQFYLPDSRGLVKVGAGAHGTLTCANGTAYNGGSVGASRNDQMQGHWHQVDKGDLFVGASTATRSAFMGDTADGLAASDFIRAKAFVSDGTNGTPRTGDETRPAEIAVLVCIKY